MRIFKTGQGAIKPLRSLQFGISYPINGKNLFVGFLSEVKDTSLCLSGYVN